MIDPNVTAKAIEQVEDAMRQVATLEREIAQLRADIAVLVRREINLIGEIAKKTPKHGLHVYCDHCIELGASRDRYKRDWEDLAQWQREALRTLQRRDEEISHLRKA